MDIKEAILCRHSVREYQDKPIENNIVNELKKEIDYCNKTGDLNIQLVTNSPDAFNCFLSRYGKFKNVKNYIALVGKTGDNLDEKVGYYGEHLVLKAQMLGLNTCWVGLSYSKKKSSIEINDNERLVCVISLGYGLSQGLPHKSKDINSVCKITQNTPEWFINGVKSALLAPTAINQQRFYFSQQDGVVSVKCGTFFYTKVDMGIARYHFEVGAGLNNFKWEKSLI